VAATHKAFLALMGAVVGRLFNTGELFSAKHLLATTLLSFAPYYLCLFASIELTFFLIQRALNFVFPAAQTHVLDLGEEDDKKFMDSWGQKLEMVSKLLTAAAIATSTVDHFCLLSFFFVLSTALSPFLDQLSNSL